MAYNFLTNSKHDVQLCIPNYTLYIQCVTLLTEFWFLLDLVVMVAVAVTRGTSDVPISLLVAVAMETFKVLSAKQQIHTVK